jgi:hypothetical protein
MKITNWTRKIAAALAVAAGCWAPSMAYAYDIPLADPSFEVYNTALADYSGFAYSNEYRPTSAWIDDQDDPPWAGKNSQGISEDAHSSNWLYNAAYAAAEVPVQRPTPRTGVQAMHMENQPDNLFTHYNGQEVSAVFEAGKTYTFSIWAQRDAEGSIHPNRSDGVDLYIFDGTIDFSHDNALAKDSFSEAAGDYLRRLPGDTAEQSIAKWTQISISHTVLANAPEIGHPIGVGFGGPGGESGSGSNLTALDDATLEGFPDPSDPGDYNGDGKVDAADYVVWRKNPADFGGDPAGYNTWRENFGEPAASMGGGPVPEPSSLLLMAAGLLPLGARHKRGSRRDEVEPWRRRK